MDNLKAVMQNKVSRRKFISGVSAGVGVAASVSLAAGCSNNSSSGAPAAPSATAQLYTDADYLNFALNLEYLEAEFYLRAATGTGLSAADIGANPGAVTGGAQVSFTDPNIKAYAIEIANDELAHVRFLRKALGSAAVDRPAINFTDAFNAAATAAGIGSTFNPFADQLSFVVGAFTFEDVGVTAYHGAASLLTDKTTNLPAAAGILATEANHAGLIRSILVGLQQSGSPAYLTYANQISALRGTAGGGNETAVSSGTIVAANSNSITYARTVSQVLHIVYLSAAAGVVSKGGFFPNGLNGKIAASVS